MPIVEYRDLNITIEHFDGDRNTPISDADLWFEGPGFYFADETLGLNGPYKTREEAQEAAQVYCDYLCREYPEEMGLTNHDEEE